MIKKKAEILKPVRREKKKTNSDEDLKQVDIYKNDNKEGSKPKRRI